jgi:hypothetical protein
LDIAQGVVVVHWFKDTELAFSFGLINTTSFLAISLNDFLVPVILDVSGSVFMTLLIGFFLCVLSFGSSLVLMSIDKQQKKQDAGKGIGFSDIWNISRKFWVLLGSFILIQGSVYCFSYITSGYFQVRFGYDTMQAGKIMSIVFGTCAFFSPFVACIVGNMNRAFTFITGSALVIALCQFAFAIMPNDFQPILPIFYLFFIGMAYSFYSSLFWTVLPDIVGKQIIGTAFGIAYSAISLGCTVFPVIVGAIFQKVADTENEADAYVCVNVLLGFLGVFSGLAGFLLIKI